MKGINRYAVIAGMAAAMCLGTSQGLAQPPDNTGGGRQRFDPAQMTQRRLDFLKEQMEVTDDAEWKVIQPLAQKVMEKQMESMRGIGRGMFGGGPRRGADTAGNPNPNAAGRGMFGASSPETEALQRAVEGKASNAELKTAITKYAEARKARQADLEKAQAELRKVLSVRQEAIATLNGLL